MPEGENFRSAVNSDAHPTAVDKQAMQAKDDQFHLRQIKERVDKEQMMRATRG